MSDFTTATGTLVGNDIEFFNADGTLMKTGTITKNADGTSESIAWDVGPAWGRVTNGTVNPAPANTTPVASTPVATLAPGTTPAPNPAATTPAPVVPSVTNAPVVAPVATPAPTGSQQPAASGVATGDPHFRIHFGQATNIGFDMSGHDGTIFNLLREPASGLVINGQIVDTVYKAKHAH